MVAEGAPQTTGSVVQLTPTVPADATEAPDAPAIPIAPPPPPIMEDGSLIPPPPPIPFGNQIFVYILPQFAKCTMLDYSFSFLHPHSLYRCSSHSSSPSHWWVQGDTRGTNEEASDPQRAPPHAELDTNQKPRPHHIQGTEVSSCLSKVYPEIGACA